MNSVVSVASLASSTAIAAPALASSIDSDPIFELIETHRTAYVTLENSVDTDDDEAASDAFWAVQNTLRLTKPTTLAGVLAIMRYERETREVPENERYYVMGEEIYEGELPEWLLTIEQSIAALAARYASVALDPDDPVATALAALLCGRSVNQSQLAEVQQHLHALRTHTNDLSDLIGECDDALERERSRDEP